MAEALEETIAGGHGSLFIRSWRPAGAARAIVAICPGFNAHSGYYQWAADQFVAHGLAVYAVDLRGRGKSDGERFYVEDFAEYEADVHSLITLAKSREPGLPVFLLGHSAGGVTSCLYAIDYGGELAGLISEDFAFEVSAPDFVLAALKGLAHLAPHSAAVALPFEAFSRDPEHLKAMAADPLIHNEKEPFRTMAAIVHADERLKKEFPSITLPVLIIHGTADIAAKPSGSQHFYDQVGSTDKTLKLYESRFHDMLNDLGRDEVIADIKAWIDARLPDS